MTILANHYKPSPLVIVGWPDRCYWHLLRKSWSDFGWNYFPVCRENFLSLGNWEPGVWRSGISGVTHSHMIPGSYFTRHMISCAPDLYFTHDLSTTRTRGTGDWSRYAGGIGIRAALRFLQPTRFPGDLYLFYGMFNYFLSLEILIPMLLTCKIQLEWWDQPMWRRSSPPLPGTTAGMPQRIPPGSS